MDLVHQVKSITAAQGNWYRVTGTRTQPRLERVVLWVVLETRYRSPETGKGEGLSDDVIVGVVPKDIGVLGNDTDTFTKNVAGYVELDAASFRKIVSDPSLLDYNDLLWE